MKELAVQRQILPEFYIKVTRTILSLTVNEGLGKLDSASSILNNLFAPDVEFLDLDEETATEIVVGLVASTLDALWDESSAKSPEEKQILSDIGLLKKSGFSQKRVVDSLKATFFWGVNSQKI